MQRAEKFSLRKASAVPEAARMSVTEASLGTGVAHVQNEVWACNCIVVTRGDDAIVVDACWSPQAVERVRDMVAGRSTNILITHADIDHICGVGAMPDATAIMCERSAERVRDGSAGRDIVNESAKWDIEFPWDVRVDRVVEADSCIEVGPFAVHTIEARGHAVDGLGYVIEEEGIFAVGDYLMLSQHPMVWWSLSEARRSTERLLEAIDRFDLRLVVPGHGPLLSVEEARSVGAEDLAYFEAVDRAADDALRSGVSPREWHVAVESVRVPRPAPPDIEILCPRLLNAAATFRDRNVDGRLPWLIDMA
jgi:glyoxylase-like metal-dependent hydrolase (beta-lactamase superfamily II)